MSKFLNPTKWLIFCLILLLSLWTRFQPYIDDSGKFSVTVKPTDSTVFDEAYFIPQTENYYFNQYYFDIHPPLGKFLFYLGSKIYDGTAPGGLSNKESLDSTQLGNKLDNYKNLLNTEGFRLFPRLFGSMIGPMLFLIVYEIINYKSRSKSYIVPFMASLLGIFEISYIVESRYALLSQILLFFILLTMFFSLKYFYTADKKMQLLWAFLSGITLGLAISTKWFAISTIAFLAILLFAKNYRVYTLRRDELLDLINSKADQFSSKLNINKVRLSLKSWTNTILSVTSKTILQLGSILGISLLIYLSIFAMHFAMIKNWNALPDVNNAEVSDFCPEWVNDLRNNTNTATYWCKLKAYTSIQLRYNKNVPALDFTKPDEIGSSWMTWPIMSRTISYFWSTDGSNEYAFVYLVGNPVIWLISLLSIIISVSILLLKLLNLRNFESKDAVLVGLIVLYFGNWLPYALIERVMYMYHYMPALLIGMILFGYILHFYLMPRINVLQDFVKEHLNEMDDIKSNLKPNPDPSSKSIFSRSGILKLLELNDLFNLIFIILTLLAILLGYILYYPFAYLLPVNKTYFEKVSIMKEWNMKWPGN
ncbi:phospholipid carrier-dependent glycosyltransferase [bacterium]|nr:MAG: phospholipid carrier-dependent glycosyltransferase [bacterium]